MCNKAYRRRLGGLSLQANPDHERSRTEPERSRQLMEDEVTEHQLGLVTEMPVQTLKARVAELELELLKQSARNHRAKPKEALITCRRCSAVLKKRNRARHEKRCPELNRREYSTATSLIYEDRFSDSIKRANELRVRFVQGGRSESSRRRH